MYKKKCLHLVFYITGLLVLVNIQKEQLIPLIRTEFGELLRSFLSYCIYDDLSELRRRHMPTELLWACRAAQEAPTRT